MIRFPVKDKSRGQRAPEFAQTIECLMSASIASHLEGPVTRDPNLDLVAFF
jgi:hypothetical protein